MRPQPGALELREVRQSGRVLEACFGSEGDSKAEASFTYSKRFAGQSAGLILNSSIPVLFETHPARRTQTKAAIASPSKMSTPRRPKKVSFLAIKVPPRS